MVSLGHSDSIAQGYWARHLGTMEQMWFLQSGTPGPLSGERPDSEERQDSTVQMEEVQVVFVSKKAR